MYRVKYCIKGHLASDPLKKGIVNLNIMKKIGDIFREAILMVYINLSNSCWNFILISMDRDIIYSIF